jgi:tRNA(Arg) A34 adenosine deaminase TadA
MQCAFDEARRGVVADHGGPFGAVLVKDGQLIAAAHNRVVIDEDPTAHAEIVAIRDACAHARCHDLSRTTLFATCEPCPMCLGAIFWAHIDAVFYAQTQEDAALMGFGDQHIYQQIRLEPAARSIPMKQLPSAAAAPLVALWTGKDDRIQY